MKYTEDQIELIKSLMCRVGCRDESAFEAMYYLVQPYVSAVAYRVGHDVDLVDDAVQEVMTALWKYAPKYNESKSVLGWIRRITENVLHRMWYKRRGEFAYDFDDPKGEILLQRERFYNDMQKATAVHDLLDRMSDDERTVFILKYERFTDAEIAAMMGLPQRRVKYLYRLAREFLKNNF